MKPVTAIVGIAAAGVAGYFMEPTVRPMWSSVPEADETGKPDQADAPVEKPTTAPGTSQDPPVVAAVPDPPAWVADLKPDQLPEKVTLNTKVEFTVPGSQEPMVMPAGAPVSTVRIDGKELVVSPFGGPIEGRVAVMSTNLVELLGNKPPAVEPPPVASVDPMPEPEPEPMPEPEPEPAPTAAKLSEEQVVALMQSSIKGGQIKEFTFDQVLGWKAGEEEERDGETYQTGLASYKAETIFGVKNIQAQALIKDGKIARWIWPKSGMEIR